jgi:hypothetical protein
MLSITDNNETALHQRVQGDYMSSNSPSFGATSLSAQDVPA